MTFQINKFQWYVSVCNRCACANAKRRQPNVLENNNCYYSLSHNHSLGVPVPNRNEKVAKNHLNCTSIKICDESEKKKTKLHAEMARLCHSMRHSVHSVSLHRLLVSQLSGTGADGEKIHRNESTASTGAWALSNACDGKCANEISKHSNSISFFFHPFALIAHDPIAIDTFTAFRFPMGRQKRIRFAVALPVYRVFICSFPVAVKCTIACLVAFEQSHTWC